jgi:hypothetical protein
MGQSAPKIAFQNIFRRGQPDVENRNNDNISPVGELKNP